MTDVQLIFDALPPPTKTENCDALCQGIHPQNEVRDVECPSHGSCKTLHMHNLELNRFVWSQNIQEVEQKWFDLSFFFPQPGSAILSPSPYLLTRLQFFQKVIFSQGREFRTLQLRP